MNERRTPFCIFTHASYLEESHKLRIILFLFVDGEQGLGQIRRILLICVAPLQRGIVNEVADGTHGRMLFFLSSVQVLQQLLVNHAQTAKIVKDIRFEFGQSEAVDNGLVGASETIDEYLPSISSALFCALIEMQLTLSTALRSATYCISDLMSSQICLCLCRIRFKLRSAIAAD